jgi:hypothetical protein
VGSPIKNKGYTLTSVTFLGLDPIDQCYGPHTLSLLRLVFRAKKETTDFLFRFGLPKGQKIPMQKQKLACDLEYKKGQKLANQKWLQNTPDYWTGYRQINSKKPQGTALYRKSETVKVKETRPIPRHQKLSVLQRWTRGLEKSFVLQRS